MSQQRRTAVVLAVVACFGLLPILAYWLLVGRAPTVTADEAAELLAGPDVVLVDVRTAEEFAAGHVSGSHSWPLSEIAALPADAELPPDLRNRTLLLLCRVGTRSARAALLLARSHEGRVYNVRGGLGEWTTAAPACPLAFARMQLPGGRSEELSYRESSILEQWAVTLSAFAVKPVYMILSLVLIIVLRRARAGDLVCLRNGLIAFLAGETFCAVNFLIFGEGSYLFEYLHVLGMVLAFGFVSLAIIEAIDGRLLHISPAGKRCAFMPLCDACSKVDDAVPCSVQRLWLYLIPMVIVVALMPLTASLHDDAYNSDILGTPYSYHHPEAFQVFEVRYAPLVAILLFTASFLVLRFGRSEPVTPAKQLFAHGCGFLGFGLFRMVIYGVYRDDPAWYIIWEELLELLFIIACIVVLRLFRRRLLAEADV